MQCVIRTYPNGWNETTGNLSKRLEVGWRVVFCTPRQGKNGETVEIEYILEREDDVKISGCKGCNGRASDFGGMSYQCTYCSRNYEDKHDLIKAKPAVEDQKR